MDTFDIAADLRPGTTLLEASAGTGKTWTIAALVTKHVASGEVRLDEMLVVTFTRAASQELRERVRRQLDEAVQLLADPDVRDPDNRLHDWLLDADDGRARRAARPADRGAGLASTPRPSRRSTSSASSCCAASASPATPTPRATLVEDLEQLTTEAVDDLYLARFGAEETPPWTRAAALELARAVVGDPRAASSRRGARPTRPTRRPPCGCAFARDVLEEVERRKRRLGVLSYDDLLSQLADALEDTTARRPGDRMQHRWKFVLIDEFQDTDPVQWQVFQRAFAETTHDGADRRPQAGDLRLPRRRHRHLPPGRRDRRPPTQTLGVNWRSDRPAAPLAPRRAARAPQLGEERIVVHPVEAHLERVAAARARAPRSGCGSCGAPSSARARAPSRRSRCGATTSSPTPPTTSSG